MQVKKIQTWEAFETSSYNFFFFWIAVNNIEKGWQGFSLHEFLQLGSGEHIKYKKIKQNMGISSNGSSS